MKENSKDLLERLQEKLDGRENDLLSWTDSLDELSEIEDAFRTNGRFDLNGKTILDVGTDCVKPLYIALKFKPDKIIGINERLRDFTFGPDLARKSKLFIETSIGLYQCSLFNDEKLREILRKEKVDCFDFILLSKTLHHLRTGKCVEKHKCREDERTCRYRFDEKEIFEKLLRLGKRVIVYEAYYPHEEDEDKVRGRGGYFTTKELGQMLLYLHDKHEVRFIQPQQFNLDKKALNRVGSMLKKVDVVCFYVEH